MLLLKEPKRVSTDIDIIVNNGTNLDLYLNKVWKKYPFLSLEDNSKDEKCKIKHYVFQVQHTSETKPLRIRLDILIEDCPYSTIKAVELSSPLLISTGIKEYISVPSIECLLADKLSAFAPHTIGVNPEMTSFGKPIDNHLQVIKQLYDIGTLFEEAKEFEETKKTYIRIIKSENELRNADFSMSEILDDSFNAALSVATLGAFSKDDYQKIYKDGISKIRDHIFSNDFNVVSAQQHAVNTMLLTAGLKNNKDVFSCNIPKQKGFKDKKYNGIKSIYSSDYFNRAAYAIRLFDQEAN